MNQVEIEGNQSKIIGRFPNNLCYTKRMAEELLVKHQQSQMDATNGSNRIIPLVIIRPSIIAASFEEPFPGWTDSLGPLGSLYSIGGHGVLQDLPLNPKLIGDQIPVDFVSNQLLTAIPISVQ